MIDFLILTMNRKGIVARCFKSLAPTLARDDVRWRVLDNGSVDGTAEWLMKVAATYPGKVLVDLHAVNTGVAGGRDILLRQSDAETLIILDSDVEAQSAGWLDRLLAGLHQPGVWVAGPGGCYVRKDWMYYEALPRNQSMEADVVSGYCQAIKRDLLDAGFEMDLKFNPRWHEDSFTCLWAKEHGGKVWHTGNIGLAHMFSHTGDDGRSYQKQLYLASMFRGKGLIHHERIGGNDQYRHSNPIGVS